jgi:hypothetical protein
MTVPARSIQVDHTSLDAVTHEDAVNTLKATGTQVSLLFIKNPHPEVLNQSQDSSTHQRSIHPTPSTPGAFSYTQPPLAPVHQRQSHL